MKKYICPKYELIVLNVCNDILTESLPVGSRNQIGEVIFWGDVASEPKQ